MLPPYIGFTGATDSEDVVRILTTSVPKHSTHFVMVGVLASTKTLRGEQNKWPQRYPIREKLASVFVGHSRAINLIHLHSEPGRQLLYDMRAIHELGVFNFGSSSQLCGFQLNVKWPNLAMLKKYRKYHDSITRRMIIVLQIGSEAIGEARWDPNLIAERVKEYGDLIDYVLIDPSGGHKIKFNPQLIAPCLRAIKEKCRQELRLVVAGGLGPETLHNVEALLPENPDISIDAEGALIGDDGKQDTQKTCLYLERSFDMFERIRK